MLVTVVLPIAILVVLVAFGWRWYRGKVAGLAADSATREIRGVRLTAERLRTLANPPWRVVFEIGPTTLGSIDHVVVGPGGAIAIETLFSDRPDTATGPEAPTATTRSSRAMDAGDPAHIAALAAIARDDVDALLGPGASCTTLARVYWGAPDPSKPAAVEISPGLVAVEGQRLVDWLTSLPPGLLEPSHVDLAWQQLVIGIGRPDPLP